MDSAFEKQANRMIDDVDTEDNWLEDSPGDFERLTNLITEDLTKPTESLISLLYQSVSIRDSRHSLELGVSSTSPFSKNRRKTY
jgi:hypothetical protein